MTEQRAELERTRERLTQSDDRTRLFTSIAVSAFLFAAVAVLLGYGTIGAAGGSIAVLGAVAAVQKSRRRARYRTVVLEQSTAGAEQAVIDGLRAIRARSFDDAASEFERALTYGELGSAATDVAPDQWETRGKNDGVQSGLALEYCVANSYLSLLDAYRESVYDAQHVERQLDDAEAALNADKSDAAIGHLVEAAESLGGDGESSTSSPQTADLKAVSGVGEQRATSLTDAGIDDPVRLAHLSIESLAELPAFGERTAESVRSAARKMTADAGYLSRLANDAEAEERYHERWQVLSDRLQDELLTESSQILERGIQKLPTPDAVSPETAEARIEQHQAVASQAVLPLTRLQKFERAVAETQGVTVDLSHLAPDRRLPRSTPDEYQTALGLALERTATVQESLDISQGRAERIQTVARDRVSEEPTLADWFEASVDAFLSRRKAYESIARWHGPCDDAIELGEQELQHSREVLTEDPTQAETHLDQARDHLTEAESILESAVFPDATAKAFQGRIDNLRSDVRQAAEAVRRGQGQGALDDAKELVETAAERITTAHYETAKAKLQKAERRLATAEPHVDDTEIATLREEAERLRADIAAAEATDVLDGARESLQRAQNALGDEPEVAAAELSEARAGLDEAREIGEAVRVDCDHQADLIARLDGFEEQVEQTAHKIGVSRDERALEEAEELLDDARDAVERSELEIAWEAVDAARERISTISAAGLDDAQDAVRTEITDVEGRLVEEVATVALDGAQHELNRARGYLQHSVDDTRGRLAAARTHLRAAEFLATDPRLEAAARENHEDRVDRYHAQVETLVERCAEREIEEAVNGVTEVIEDARATFRSGAVDAAHDRVDEAAERIDDVRDLVPADYLDALEQDLEAVESLIARRSANEYVANAESTVDEAEAARVAGEEAEAIRAYRRAIGTYEIVQVDAVEAELPEQFEIERRIEQLTDEIDAVRSQWVRTRTTQIDREIRAGERAVSRGLQAAEEGELDVAESEYDSAAESASAARSWLRDATESASDEGLTMPSELAAEYRAAASSLTGHLGYLRTQIEEATETGRASDGRATPLAEYYDGLYTVYRAMPGSAHPLWRQALTTVLFGGDGLGDGVTEYAAQQADRNDTPIATVREANGDGESIREFVCIDAADPRPDDHELVARDQQIPVAPDSGTVLPIAVDADGVVDAIELLNEFPAFPDADTPGGTAGSLLDLQHFERQLESEATSGTQQASGSPGGRSVSNELAELQQELDAQIGDL